MFLSRVRLEDRKRLMGIHKVWERNYRIGDLGFRRGNHESMCCP